MQAPIQMTDSPTMVFASASTQTSLYIGMSKLKRKRKPAGTPDPDAQVIALSPQTLMESDRYICEICNQGFQRDQNLQMHRRRHKVPWKLLKRADPDARKRVYICPEPSCLHHNPCHALGDLVGIKKHYRRKHSSMKQWECEKCSKAYAVQSDYKAHMKTCGTRGHCCDCGRVFSRVESFIEHQDTCTATRNKKKKGGASSNGAEGGPAPSPSLVNEPASAALMATSSAHSSGNITKEHYNHHSSAIHHLHQSEPLLTNYDHHHSSSNDHHHSCAPLHHRAVLGLLPQTTPSLTPPTAAMITTIAAEDGSMACRQMSQHDLCNITQLNSPIFQQQRAELQLLPTSKLPLNQLESSQGSETLGKEMINSSNSTTSSRTCCSPGSKNADEKLAHRSGADCPRMLHHMLRGAASSSSDAPLKLQLSIGLSNDDQNSKLLESKGVSLPWLLQGEVITQRNHDACHENSLETPKSYSSLCSTTDAKQAGIAASCTDGNKDAVDLKLASSNLWLHQQAMAAATLCSSNVHHNENLHRFSDQDSTLIHSRSNQYEEELALAELLQAKKRSCQIIASKSQGANQKAKQMDFSTAPASEMQAAVEALVKEAREKLERASMEKLQAEKAWTEARREREQAEKERAKAQRIADYNRMLALGSDPKPEDLGAKSGIKPTCSSLINCQKSASASVQIMQLHERRVLCASTPSFITCPSCHHISQLLYSPPNKTMGTALFGASPLELGAAPPSTISSFMLPSSPTQLSS